MHFTFNRVLPRALLVAFNPTKLPLCPPVMSSHVATGHYDRRGRRRQRRRQWKRERDKEYRERDELSSQLHSNITSAPMISSRSSYSLIGAYTLLLYKEVPFPIPLFTAKIVFLSLFLWNPHYTNHWCIFLRRNRWCWACKEMNNRSGEMASRRPERF